MELLKPLGLLLSLAMAASTPAQAQNFPQKPAHACMVHNPGYDFNDDILPVGAAFWALLTQRYQKD